MLIFPAAEFFYESPDVAVGEVVKQGELIPPDEESFNHTARVCDVGPDNKLYISLGQPFNVPPPEKADNYNEVGIGGIIRMDRDGTEPRGLRARHPQLGRPGLRSEHRRALVHRQPGRRHGRRHPAGRAEPRDRPGPAFRLPLVRRRRDPHQRIQGFRAARGRGPAGRGIHRACRRSRHDVLHGQPVPGEVPGRRLLRPARLVEPHRAGRRAGDVHADQRGRHGRRAGGVRRGLAARTAGEYLGRPVDVAQLPDGSLLVSDDLAGAVYRISYDE